MGSRLKYPASNSQQRPEQDERNNDRLHDEHDHEVDDVGGCSFGGSLQLLEVPPEVEVFGSGHLFLAPGLEPL